MRETLPNPKLNDFPISEVSQGGHKHNIPLIMDNTAAPIFVSLCNMVLTLLFIQLQKSIFVEPRPLNWWNNC